MNRAERRAHAKAMASWSRLLTPVPRAEWPPAKPGVVRPAAVWRSRYYLVQAFNEDGAITRLSVNRTTLNAEGRWDDNITWDELQRIKAECGFGDCFAVEVFPAQRDIVNVANMRHLWILPKPLPFAWFRPDAEQFSTTDQAEQS